MKLLNTLIIIFGKLFLKVVKILSIGSGSTWPGHIALNLNNNFINNIVSASKLEVILIAGTNGKTTTSTLLKFILEKQGKKVFQNEEGANLMNGIASSMIKNATLTGKLAYDYAVFEVDENVLPLILKKINPRVIIILNLFRDQLDRYGEVNSIARNWKKSFYSLPKEVTLVLNGDDPQINYLGKDIKAEVLNYGLADELMQEKEIPHDVDSVYCPNCGEKLKYLKMSYSHLGNYECPKCTYSRSRVVTYSSELLSSSLKGLYNYYNASAVFLTVEILLNLPVTDLSTLLKEFKPAFGRQELITYKKRNVFLLLSKNPTGFNQSIEAIKEYSKGNKTVVIIALNDRVPDGRDISWIWDVEFQNILPISKKVIVTGDRTYDMALRIKYSLDENSKESVDENKINFENNSAIPSLDDAINEAVKNTSEDELIFILATYSAMLDAREILVGKKLP